MKNLATEENKTFISGQPEYEMQRISDIVGGILPTKKETALKMPSDASGENEKIEVCKYCGKAKEKKILPAPSGKRPLVVWVSQCECEEKAEKRKQKREENIKRIKHLKKVYKSCGYRDWETNLY